MKNVRFCGFNGFQQFGSAHATKVLQATESKIFQFNEHFLFSSSWAYNAFASKNKLVITGFIEDEPDKCFEQETIAPVKQLTCNDNFCLALLENGEVYKLNRSIFGDLKEDLIDPIEHIACGTSISVAISKRNTVFNIPSKIYEFPKHEKIKSLVCGFEHALALNSNGDIYSWGNGMRGQLGAEDIKIQELPRIIEALAGIKIISVSVGGWHSAAISAFGDIYTWGSNINGQLGILLHKLVSPNEGKQISFKNPTIYPLPQIIDLYSCCNETNQAECAPAKVVCGARHTVVQNTCGRLFSVGWNKYGQLGLNIKKECIDQFTALNSSISNDVNVFCGPWCTVLILK